MYRNSQYYILGIFISVTICVFFLVPNKWKVFSVTANFDDYELIHWCLSQNTIDITTAQQREDYAESLYIKSAKVKKAKYVDFLFVGSDGNGTIIFDFVDSETSEIFSVVVDGVGLVDTKNYKRLDMDISFFKENYEYILFLNEKYPSYMDDSVYIVNDFLNKDRTYYELTVNNDTSKVAVGENYNVLSCPSDGNVDYIKWSEINDIDYISRSYQNYDDHFMNLAILIQTKYENGDFK